MPDRARRDHHRHLFYRGRREFDEASIVESEEVRPGLVLDFDAKGRVVGLEMLRVKESLPDADLNKVLLEVA